MANEKITVKWNRVVEEVLGDDKGVTGVRLAATDGEMSERLLPMAYLLRSVMTQQPLRFNQL